MATGTPPSAFEVQATVVVRAGASYDVDINTPGFADPRRLTARLVVDEGGVALEDEVDPGTVRISDPGVDGAARTVTIAAGPFDIGSAATVTAQVRLAEPAGAGRPWLDVLPCGDGQRSFTWRVPGESVVRQGWCPAPFDWVSSAPIVPSLRPTPATVATAAGFGAPATLDAHIGRLVAAFAGTPVEERGLVVRLEVGMLLQQQAGVPAPVVIPILLAPVDPLQVDELASQVAAAIRIFEAAQGAPPGSDLSFSLTLSSSAAPGLLSSTRDVVLPGTSITG